MKILLYFILFLYFFLPFQFALNPAPGFDIAIVRIFILIILLFYFAYSLWQKKLFIPRGWIAGLFTAFLMWLLLSIFITPVPEWTIRKIIFLFSFSSVALILTTLFISVPTTRKVVIKAAVLGAGLISIVGILQFISQFIFSLDTILDLWSRFTPFFLGGTFSDSVITYNSWLVNINGETLMRSIAFFPDPHIFSFYLGLIIPLSLSLFFISHKKIWLICFCLILVADLLTFSRGAYIGLFGGAIVGITLLWPQIKTSLRHFIILFLISFFFLLLIPHNPISSRFMSSLNQSDTSNTHRIELWTRAVEEIGTRPLFGTGLGAYSHTINPLATYRTPIYVHNIFLDIWVEIGIIGLFLFVGTFISCIYILYKKRNDYIALFAIISIGIFFFHALFDTPIFSVHVFPILLLIISISISYENQKD